MQIAANRAALPDISSVNEGAGLPTIGEEELEGWEVKKDAMGFCQPSPEIEADKWVDAVEEKDALGATHGHGLRPGLNIEPVEVNEHVPEGECTGNSQEGCGGECSEFPLSCDVDGGEVDPSLGELPTDREIPLVDSCVNGWEESAGGDQKPSGLGTKKSKDKEKKKKKKTGKQGTSKGKKVSLGHCALGERLNNISSIRGKPEPMDLPLPVSCEGGRMVNSKFSVLPPLAQ